MANLEKIAHLAEESEYDVSTPRKNWDELDMNKLQTLGSGTKHDVCASTATPRVVKGLQRVGNTARGGICHSFTPDGRCVSLFKTLFTNECAHDCSYCPNSDDCSTKSKTYSYTPQELADITLSLYQGNYVEGLFLSSGTGKDEDIIMEKLIETVRILREEYKYEGYIHLKILPGTNKDYIKRSLEYADRVSLNIESCSKSRLHEVSSTKHYDYDILRRQRYIRDLMRKKDLPAGHTTQTIVGGAGENDKEIFESMIREYRRMDIKRMYYSSFKPVEGTGLDDREEVPNSREHRLYQTDWLFRVYDLKPSEITLAFDEKGFLPDGDPKMKIAKRKLNEPVDPNEASYKRLIRVPGIGPKSARRILKSREEEKITKWSELSKLGVVIKRARTFLEVNGWKHSTLDRWSS